MSFFTTIKSFQKLYGNGKNFRVLTQLFGVDFGHWFNIVRRVLLRVAKKISRPDSNKVRKCFSKCVSILTTYAWEQKDWNVSSFVLILQRVDPRLSAILFQILYGVVNHPEFSEYFANSRKYIRESVQSLQNVDGKYRNVHRTLRVYDAFVGMVGHWFVPVPQPLFSMPFLRDRLPLCELNYKFANIAPSKKGQMICISSHLRFLVLKLFSNREMTPISRQLAQVLQKYFGDELTRLF